MDLLVNEIVERFYALLWPMIRVSAFLLAAPFFSLRAVTVRIRVLLAALLTLMVYPLTEWPIIEPFSAPGLREMFNQVLIGTIMAVSRIWALGDVPGWLYAGIALANLLSAASLFAAIWKTPQALHD